MQIDIATTLALVLCLSVLLLGVRARRSPGVDRALLEDHSRLKTRVTTLEEGLKGCATRADMVALSGKIDALEEHAASAGDINALEGKVNVIGERVQGVKETVNEMRDSVKFIERVMMKREA